MYQKENYSSKKIDEQIKKLARNNYDDSEDTPVLNRKELERKIRLEKLDKKIEKNKKKNISEETINRLEKTIVKDKVDVHSKKKKEQELKRLYNDKKVVSRNNNTSKKRNYLDKKEQLKEILDDQKRTNDIIKKLSYIFLGFLGLMIIIFTLICII